MISLSLGRARRRPCHFYLHHRLRKGNKRNVGHRENGQTATNQPREFAAAQNVKAVSQTDHVLGNLDASVKVIEFPTWNALFVKATPQ